MNSVRSKVCGILKEFRDPRSEIVAVLGEMQKEFGCLPEEALKEVADRTETALVRLLEVISSHRGLVLEKDIERPIEVCTCPNCTTNGGAELLSGLREVLLLKTCSGGIGTRYYIAPVIAQESPCVEPPTVTVNGQTYRGITLSKLLELIGVIERKPLKCRATVKPAT